MGIINFRGKRDKTIFKPAEQILVSDYMTKKLITFKPSDSLGHVINLLIKNKISGGPVVNDKNELIGIISEGDCMKHISDSKYYNMPMDSDNTVEKNYHSFSSLKTLFPPLKLSSDCVVPSSNKTSTTCMCHKFRWLGKSTFYFISRCPSFCT